MLKDFLQGRWLGHPLHPVLVHFPVGLWVLSLLFDLATYALGPANWLVRGAFYAMALGFVMAVGAAVPGLVDWADIRADHPGKKIATYHMVLNVVAIVLYALNLVLRRGDMATTRTSILPLVLSLIGIGLISVSGYLGGMLVYDEGIAVGRHRRHTHTPRMTIRVPVPPGQHSADGLVRVASVDALQEGETLRADVGGNVMTIVRLGGQFYAFQEFCTHRFGPLSEGSFHDHQVECPWHRSCFDVRTGKVTQGPARVDLKTYQVEVRGDDLMVRVEPGAGPEQQRRTA
jgi:nitrite reductase/ring-hydroxylating ferredoxin subunit/uncharacterized membrane protein